MNKIQISQKRLDNGIYWERAWTLINGCTKVSEACDNCWAERMHNQFGGSETIDWKGNIRVVDDNLDLPLWIKKPTVFAIWNDLFHEKVPFEFIEQVFGIMAAARYHTFLVLTKRPERMLEYCKWQTNLTGEGYLNEGNVWLGVTAENQKRVDERIPILLQIPAAVRFVSVEPMLESIDLDKFLSDFIHTGYYDEESGTEVHDIENKISWIVLGAESGPKRRLISLDAIRNVKEQCQEADIPLFIKQLNINGKLVKDMNQFPEDLQIREFPI